MGATLVEGGATFRVWAPRATEVYLNGTFGTAQLWDQSPEQLMLRDANGYWTGFVAGAAEGDEYKFFVTGAGSQGYKRDPYARELCVDPPFPHCNCVLRGATAFPWSDSSFVTPDYSNSIVYQLHVGTYAPEQPGAMSTVLDVVERIEYLVALGINVLQPLPIDEAESSPSMGYNGTDYFSPDLPYIVTEASALAAHLATINRLRAAKGAPAVTIEQLTPAPNQVKALVDTCHLYGIAVVFDVVYNHAGGFSGDDEAIYFKDRATAGDNNNSLYFTDQGWAGGLSFAMWNQDVREFLINTARYYVEECHIDGLRYDEISALVSLNGADGYRFCQDITSTLRFIKPSLLQNAEYWPVDPSYVTSPAAGGAGFDVTQHDALRLSVRAAIAQSSYGAEAPLDLDAVAGALYPAGFAQAWQAVTCVENHDIVKVGTDQRLPVLADGSNPRSWYARSRSRVAEALLLTAPGIPQIFMGQEFLEEKQWSDNPSSPYLIDWAGAGGADPAMVNHLRFSQDLIRLRWTQPALRSACVRAFHVHNENRVLAFHRWIEEEGRDVVVVASLCESTYDDYMLGFPGPGRWLEVFNSDVYDNWVNPLVAGNGGAVEANGGPMHGFGASASVVIPANGVVVFARDAG